MSAPYRPLPVVQESRHPDEGICAACAFVDDRGWLDKPHLWKCTATVDTRDPISGKPAFLFDKEYCTHIRIKGRPCEAWIISPVPSPPPIPKWRLLRRWRNRK